MSTENFNPEKDEFLNKLVKFKHKKDEIVKINNIVDKLAQELPPKDIRNREITWNWMRISGILVILIIIIVVVFLLIKPSIGDETNGGIGTNTNVIKATSNYSFYILNNVGQASYFKLSYDQSNKIKEILPDSSLYNITFITQFGKSTFQFGNKDSLILKLNEEIKNGGDMDWEGIISLFNSLNESCKSKINMKYFIMGKTPEVNESDKIASKAVFDLKLLNNLNNCKYVELIQFGDSSKDYEETTLFFRKFFTKYKIKHEFIK